MLKAKSIRTGLKLGRIDCSIEKPNAFKSPNLFFTSYLDDKTAIIGYSPVSIPYTFAEVLRIENCLDVSISFECAWQKTLNNSYAYYTIGQPYVAYVNVTNTLYVRQLGQSAVMLATGVNDVTIHRGWKNTVNADIDQGLMVIYRKTNNSYYYRKLINAVWSNEEPIPELGQGSTPIRCFLTNDYRTGITANNRTLLTERCMAGIGIPNEHFEHTQKGLEGVLAEIKNTLVDATTEYFTVDNKLLQSNYLETRDIQVFVARNYLGGTIIIGSDVPLIFDSLLEIKENINIKAGKYSLIITGFSYVTKYIIQLELKNFNWVSTDITVQYKAVKPLAHGSTITPVSVSFSPVGLDNSQVAHPKVTSARNISDKVIEVKFDLDVEASDITAKAFSVENVERNYCTGPTYIVSRTLDALRVIDTKTFEISLTGEKTFRNALGNLTLKYNSDIGDICGEAPVETFETTFVPTGLIEKLNPGLTERFTAETWPLTGGLKHIVDTPITGPTERFTQTVYPTKGSVRFIGDIQP